jgi:hypothetical protein
MDAVTGGAHRFPYGFDSSPDELITMVDKTAFDSYWSPGGVTLAGSSVMPDGDGAALDLLFTDAVTPDAIQSILLELLPGVSDITLLALDDSSILNAAPAGRGWARRAAAPIRG